MKTGYERYPMTEETHCVHPECIYRAAGHGTAGACDYLTVTGKSRIKGLPPKLQLPCNCPYYIPDGTEREREPEKEKSWQEKAAALHRAGATDREIAAALDLKKDTVRVWRYRHGLPVNRDRMGDGEHFDWTKARELYDEGACDTEIMELLGCSRSTVYKWRDREGLPLHPAWERRAEKKRKGK